MEPMLLPPQTSPTRARSPDVISSASTAMSQDIIPEIASETLPRGLAEAHESHQGLQDSMVSAASALHLLSPLELSGGAVGETEQRLSSTPSLLETALSHENAANAAAASCSDSSVNRSWPAAPDITRETRNSLRDNGLGEW